MCVRATVQHACALHGAKKEKKGGGAEQLLRGAIASLLVSSITRAACGQGNLHGADPADKSSSVGPSVCPVPSVVVCLVCVRGLSVVCASSSGRMCRRLSSIVLIGLVGAAQTYLMS